MNKYHKYRRIICNTLLVGASSAFGLSSLCFGKEPAPVLNPPAYSTEESNAIPAKTEYKLVYPSDGSYLHISDVIGAFTVSAKSTDLEDYIDAIILDVKGESKRRLRIYTQYDLNHFNEKHFREGRDEQGRRVVSALNPDCHHSNFSGRKEGDALFYHFGADPGTLPDGAYMANVWIKEKGKWKNQGIKSRLDSYLELNEGEIERVTDECEIYLSSTFTVDKSFPTARLIEESENHAKILFEDNHGLKERTLRVYHLTEKDLVDITDSTRIEKKVDGKKMVVELRGYPCKTEELVFSVFDLANNSLLFSPKIGKDELTERIRKINFRKFAERQETNGN